MPPRFDQYERLIAAALERGYTVHSVRSLWDLVERGRLDSSARYLVLRHDVDTDPGTAEAMWRIEQGAGVPASYYFRLCTLDVPLMQRIERSGSEASYHYEELAAYAKEARLKEPVQVRQALPAIQAGFRHNLLWLREKTGLRLDIVAAHGDFVNRVLGIPNWELLRSQALRRELGIRLEVYDRAMASLVTSRHADAPYPSLWQPSDPLDAIKRGEPVIYVLTHPRHWRANPWQNIGHDARRLWEGVRYRR